MRSRPRHAPALTFVTALLALAGCVPGQVGDRLGPTPLAPPPASPTSVPPPAAAPARPNSPPPPAANPPLPFPEELLCPDPVPAPAAALSTGFARQCAGCHGATGEGRGTFPALRALADRDAFVRIVREGRKEMPAFDEPSAPRARLLADFAVLNSGAALASGADPDCGPGASALPAWSAAVRDARITRGLAAYRREGPKGACAGCHAASGLDLAFVGYSDADILRRAIPQVGTAEARAIVELVHALRARHKIDRPLHPRRFRFLQPGHAVLPELRQPAVYPELKLPGERDAARDAAFARALTDEVELRLVGPPITTLEQARAAEQQLTGLDLGRLKVGVPFPRWSEDGFHGSASNVPNEWVAMLARRPLPGHAERWHALVDAYLADPSATNLWRVYDAIESHTAGEPSALAARLSLRKYQSVQVAAHMLLSGSSALPDPFADGAGGSDPAQRRAVAIARNPFWRVGDSVRQNPLNCNQPDPCTRFPPSIDATMNPGDEARERQSYEEKLAWFWLGFTLDPALVVTEDALATVSGDYFLALTQPWYQVHNAFIVAAIATAKANARAYATVEGVALPGHGRWASPRPFLTFKHSERELHHPPRNDLRHPIHERLWANAFRMFLFLMHDEVGRTGEVFDRKATLAAVDYMIGWFGRVLEPGADHSALRALVIDLRGKLTLATEIGVSAPY